MITQCRFCNFQRKVKVDTKKLDQAAKAWAAGVTEDFGLFMSEAMRGDSYGTRAWGSVKIHMGMKHKSDAYPGIWPNNHLEQHEMEVVRKHVPGWEDGWYGNGMDKNTA